MCSPHDQDEREARSLTIFCRYCERTSLAPEPAMTQSGKGGVCPSCRSEDWIPSRELDVLIFDGRKR